MLFVGLRGLQPLLMKLQLILQRSDLWITMMVRLGLEMLSMEMGSLGWLR